MWLSKTISKNTEIRELQKASDRYHDISVQSAKSSEQIDQILDTKEFITKRLLGELYNNLSQSEKQFAELIKDFRLLKWDYKIEQNVDTRKKYKDSIQSMAYDIIQEALTATIQDTQWFFYKQNILNIFQPADLVEYIQYFQEPWHISDNFNEGEYIQYRENQRELHPIVETREYIQDQEMTAWKKFDQTIRQKIQHITPYFKHYPEIFIYWLAKPKLICQYEMRQFIKKYFHDHYYRIKLNNSIDQRYL